MFALDLFNTKYERELQEGALDDTISRTQAHLMEPLSRRAAEIRTQLRAGELRPMQIQQLEREYEDLVDKRMKILKGEITSQEECMGYGGLVGEDVYDTYANTYSPEAIALGKRFCEHYNITDDDDIQFAVEIIDNELEGFKHRNEPVDLKRVKSSVADAFRQAFRGIRTDGPNFRKKFQEAGLPDVADKAAKMDRLNQPGKVGTDVVTPQQRVNPNPNKGVVGHAVDWLRGRGGPGKEGPTLESELDEQEGDSRVYAARLVFQQIIKAVQDNVDFATITWPDNSSQKLTRNQLWHLVQKARGMSRQARNQFALKVLPTVNDLMYYLGNLKKVDARPQVKPTVDPNQPSLDLPKPLEELAQKKNSEDPDLDSKTARDATVQRELQKMRARQPNARSDIEALVKDEMDQQEKTNQDLEQLRSVNSQQDAELKKVLSLNTQQDQEISNLNQELSRLDGKLNQALGKSTQPATTSATTPATAKPTTVAPTTSTVSTPGEMPLTVDNKTDQEIAKLQSQINQLETMMTLKAPSDPAAEARLQQQISKLETQIKKLSKQPTTSALPKTAAAPTPVGSTPQLPNIEPTTLPAIEVPSVRAGSNDINVGNRRPVAATDNDFDILDLGDFDDLVDEPATKKKKKKHQDTTVDRPAGTAPFTGGTKNNQWGPKNMPGGRFTVQDVDPYDIGVHEAVEPGEEISTNELLYRAAVEYMQHMGREGRPIDYETAVKLAAKYYHIPYRPGMVPELHAKRQELDAKLAAAIAAKQAERGARKQRQLSRTAPTTPEQEKRTQDYWSKHAPQATRVKAPTKSLEEDQQLHVGDPVIVTAPNEFEGATGEIYDFAPSGKFVIVNLYNHGKHSMHLSDVEYNQYADDQDEKEFWNGDKEVNESNMSELDAMRQYLELMNDRQFKVAYGISKVAFRQKYRALLNPAPAQDVPVEEGFQDFNKVEPYEVCLAGKCVKTFDYYEDARRFHDNWKKKLYREGDKAKADKITLNPVMKEQGVAEAGPNAPYTPSPAKPFRNPRGFNKQGTGVGNKLAQQNRAELANIQPSKGTPVPAKEFAQGVLKDLKKVNVKEAEGSWIAYDPETKQIKKRFKTHTAGKSYAQTHGLGFASSEYYFDRVKEPVNELDVNTLKSYADKRGAQVAAMKADNPNPQTGSKEWVQQAVPAQQVGLANRKIARKERQQGVAEAVPAQASGVDPKIQFLQPTIQFAEKLGYRVTLNPQGRVVAKLVNKQLGHIVHIGLMQPSGKGFEVSMADNLDWQTNAWSAKELAQDFKEWHVRAVKDQDFNNGYNERPQLEQQGVAEAETDYSKRRQRERDIDAGRPVKPLPKNPQTDYARKRAKDRKDMELGETHEPQKFIVTINGKATSPLYPDIADRLYAAAKRAQPNARIEKTPAPTTQRQKGIDRVKAGYGDEDALELHEQLPSTPPANRKEYLDQRDKLFRMLALETNPANKQIIKTAIQNLDARYGSAKNPVNEESSTSSEAVEIAVIKRILVAHTNLIMQFGLDKVTQAIEEVAYNVGDLDEIGTSDGDVSGWVNQVEQILGVEA